jgi:hypothetical protein
MKALIRIVTLIVMTMTLWGCAGASSDDTPTDLAEVSEALYPGPVARPAGAYIPIFMGSPDADVANLCNFVRNLSITKITRVVSYNPNSSVEVEFNIVRGTSGPDELVGTDGPDLLCGYESDDILRGLRGNDILIGGAGNDTLYGACGQDFAWGGIGRDTIFGETGTSSVCGITIGPNSPDANNMTFSDIIYGGPDVDTINSEWGTDAVFGGDYFTDDSTDTITCGVSNRYGGTAYVLHPSSGVGWIADTITGCESVINVK